MFECQESKNQNICRWIVLKILENLQLLCFLNACDGVDDAANVMSTYYEIRQKHSAIFHNRDPLSPEIQQCLANQLYFHLPNTPTGHSVIYHNISDPKASNYVFDEACKTFFMTIGKFLQIIFCNVAENLNFRFFIVLAWTIIKRTHYYIWHAEHGYKTFDADESGDAAGLFSLSSRRSTRQAGGNAYR